MSVPISRLTAGPPRRENKQTMNCKSCRKRKIRCDRVKPACKSCTVMRCPCEYDATPKKRGPKTDAFETLSKRGERVENQLEHGSGSEHCNSASSQNEIESAPRPSGTAPIGCHHTSNIPPTTRSLPVPTTQPSLVSEVNPNDASFGKILLDIYFKRSHGRPLHILHEATFRYMYSRGEVSPGLMFSVLAVAVRYANVPGGLSASQTLADGFIKQAREKMEDDDLSIENVQALCLLSIAFGHARKLKMNYMLQGMAAVKAMALQLHVELPMSAVVNPIEREVRRRLFWAIYLQDRWSSCINSRPSVISDEFTTLKLPTHFDPITGANLGGTYFTIGSNLLCFSGGGRGRQAICTMLTDVSRILGLTNAYLSTGGAKVDTYFPWHEQSYISRIRTELEVWANASQVMFSGDPQHIYGQLDSTALVMSKLIYHFIHCLILRPFLPIMLFELSGNQAHNSWQIQATKECLIHADSIAELAQTAKAWPDVEWNMFSVFMMITAATVHIHAVHYRQQDHNVMFAKSARYLEEEVSFAHELTKIGDDMHPHIAHLKRISALHTQVVESIAARPGPPRPLRYQPGDFFDRYPDPETGSDLGSFRMLSKKDAHFGQGSLSAAVAGRPESLTPTSSIISDSLVQHTDSLSLFDASTSQSISTGDDDDNNNLLMTDAQHKDGQTRPQTGFMNTFQDSSTPAVISMPQNPVSALEAGSYNFPASDHSFMVPAPPQQSVLFNSPLDSVSAQNNSFYHDFPQQTIISGYDQTNIEQDPFLSVLEELQSNRMTMAGPSELDYYLAMQAM